MTNPNEREPYNREVNRESYTDSNGNTQTHITRTTETSNNRYANGYVDGRRLEQNYQADRDNENTATGLIFGIVLTSLVGLIAGAFWYFNQNNATVDSTTPVETPLPAATASPSISPQPQQTTIIERTREVPVVVPQQQVAPSPTNSPPQVNITVPPQPSVRVTVPPVAPNTPAPTRTTTPNTNTQASPSPSITTEAGDQSPSNSDNSDDVNQNTNSGQ
ncbi:hypothetical protein WDZ92_23620 [Nostoc sp. NIES-2111]|jgi:hypothetical protein